MLEYILYIGIAILVVILGIVTKQIGIKNVQEWLLYAVSWAEKELPSKTGVLKLRSVYDLFITKFPWLSKFITFNYFSKLVDIALEKMKEVIEKNKDVKNYISK